MEMILSTSALYTKQIHILGFRMNINKYKMNDASKCFQKY